MVTDKPVTLPEFFTILRVLVVLLVLLAVLLLVSSIGLISISRKLPVDPEGNVSIPAENIDTSFNPQREENKRIKEWEENFDQEQKIKEEALIKKFYSDQSSDIKNQETNIDALNNTQEENKNN